MRSGKTLVRSGQALTFLFGIELRNQSSSAGISGMDSLIQTFLLTAVNVPSHVKQCDPTVASSIAYSHVLVIQHLRHADPTYCGVNTMTLYLLA